LFCAINDNKTTESGGYRVGQNNAPKQDCLLI